MSRPNSGASWEDAGGKAIALPARSEAIGQIADGRGRAGNHLRSGSIAVDPQGAPLVLWSDSSHSPWETFLTTLEPSGEWKQRRLSPHVGRILPGWGVSMPGGITFGADGRICIVLTGEPPSPAAKPGDTGWGTPTSEVVWLESNDGGASFNARLITKPDATCPHWLPSIERPTGHNRVASPALLYTSGTRGEKNTQIVSNDVFYVG